MAVYFLVLAALGILNIARHPGIVAIANPMWAIHFFALDAKLAFLALCSVVLAVTGAEALYADMVPFGRKALRIPWLNAAFPRLLITYMRKGALPPGSEPCWQEVGPSVRVSA